jgi:uncharacterized protein
VGGHSVPVEEVTLRADDGVHLHASHITRREGVNAVLVVHGFAAHRRKPAYARLADGLAVRFPVLSLDLRGHGSSGGRSSFGTDEEGDIAAGVSWLRDRGYRGIAVVGVSMGGTALVHALARRDLDLAAAVIVSTPAWIGRTDTVPLRFLDDVWRSGWKRRLLETVARIRVLPPDELDGLRHPAELVAAVRTPLLVVHGEDDHFFSFADAEDIAGAASGPVTVWREPTGFGHAEDGLTRRFARALGRGLEVALRTGRFPDRDRIRRGSHY